MMLWIPIGKQKKPRPRKLAKALFFIERNLNALPKPYKPGPFKDDKGNPRFLGRENA